MILVFILEHIPILKQLQHFSSCYVFGTFLGFETITGIHQCQFSSIYALMKQNKILALSNQNLILFCSYNMDLTRNPEYCY